MFLVHCAIKSSAADPEASKMLQIRNLYQKIGLVKISNSESKKMTTHVFLHYFAPAYLKTSFCGKFLQNFSIKNYQWLQEIQRIPLTRKVF